MKKIYSKMTKERAVQYQIETSIYIDKNGKKIVRKSALNNEAESHINRMIRFYENSPCQDVIVPVKQVKSGCAEFEFVNGKTFYECMIAAIKAKNHSIVQQLMHDYKEIIDKLYPDVDYKTVQNNVNVDITFDNIMVDNQRTVIMDYEWIFDGTYSVGFVIYRALYAFFQRDAHMITDTIKFDDALDYFGILDQKELYDAQNIEFNKLVFGEISYADILKKYQKNNFNLFDVIDKNDLFTQVFFDYGTGYSEADSVSFELRNQFVEIDIDLDEKIKSVRIDLCNFPFVAKNIRICKIDDLGETILSKYIDNSVALKDDYFWFWDKDPQIILDEECLAICGPSKLRISVEKMYVIGEQQDLFVSELIGEKVVWQLVKNDEMITKKNEELKEIKKCYDQKVEICKRYKHLADSLIRRVNEINAEAAINAYRAKNN